MILSRPFAKLRSVNSNSAAFPSLVAEIDLSPTDPGTAAGRVIQRLSLKGGNGLVPERMTLFPYALGTNNDTFDMRIIGWRKFLPVSSSEPRSLWIPGILGQCSCTVSQFAGLAGFPVLNTELFCDTITLTNANEPTKLGNSTLRDGYTKTFSPANDTPARIVFLTEGCESIEVQFAQTLNTPAMNCLYTFEDGTE